MITLTKSQVAPYIAIPESKASELPRYARLVQFWTDQGILLPVGNARGGRGKHRHYDLLEVRFAIIASFLNCAGFSTAAIFEAILRIRNRHEGASSSPLDLAMYPNFPFDVEPVRVQLTYWPQIDAFQAEFNEHLFGRTENPLGIQMFLPLDAWFAQLRKTYGEAFARRDQTDASNTNEPTRGGKGGS